MGLTAFILTTLLFNLLFANFDDTTFGGRPRPRFVVGVGLITFFVEQISFAGEEKIARNGFIKTAI